MTRMRLLLFLVQPVVHGLVGSALLLPGLVGQLGEALGEVLANQGADVEQISFADFAGRTA